MREDLLEDSNEVFPINSQVRCGQTALLLGFANMTLEDSEKWVPAHLQRCKKRRWTPRVPARK